MSWRRAVATALLAVVVSVGLLVYVPNIILTHLGASRSVRVALATASFFVSLVAISAALRVLQGRHVL